MGHYVTAPLVVAKDVVGADVYLYGGSQVPGNVSESEVARLLEGGFIAESEAEGDPSESWTVKQLKAHAVAADIDLGGASSKADILAALAAAKA
jgi:hypothetical protein